MIRKLARIMLLGVMLLAFSGLTGAVTWGTRDNGEHPFVGTLLFVQNGVGFFSCTGTLISPEWMLTAAHCVEGAGQTNNVTYVRFEEEALSGRASYPDTQAWLDAEWILAAQVIPHPSYDDYSAFPSTFDVGLVKLSEPVYLPKYGQLPSPNFLETLRGPERRNNFTVVGYGLQGVVNPFFSDEYARYSGTVSLLELNSTFNGGVSAKFSNNPGKGNGSGGSCFGDSGGPVFYADTHIIAAVVSFGITPCIGVDYQYRMDTSQALTFVRSYVP